MKTINIHQAKTHLSKLIQKVLQGEEVVISKYGEPLVKLEPYHPQTKRKPGIWKDKVKISDDFDELPPDLKKGFAGELD